MTLTASGPTTTITVTGGTSLTVATPGTTGPAGADGADGLDGAAAATAPLAYDSGTHTISISGGTVAGQGLRWSGAAWDVSQFGFGDITGTAADAQVTLSNVQQWMRSLTRGVAMVQGTANESALDVSGYSVTGANTTPALKLRGTWNTTGAPALIDVDVTNTASDYAARLFSFKRDGVDRIFALAKPTTYGQAVLNINCANVTNTRPLAFTNQGDGASGIGFGWAGGGVADIGSVIHSPGGLGAVGVFSVTNRPASFLVSGNAYATALAAFSHNFTPSSAGGYGDTCAAFFITPAQTNYFLALRSNGSGQPIYQRFGQRNHEIYNTYTDAANYERLTLTWSSNVARLGTEAGGTGTKRSLVVDINTLSADPTTSDLPAGSSAVFHNSTSGVTKLWANVAGTLKSVALT